MPTLYGAPVSPFVRKTMVALAEKGVAYEHDPVLPFVAPAEFNRISKEVSPLGRIPAYRDGDLTLADSSVIIAYLERVKPSPALYPSDTRDYVRALWFEEYGDSGLSPIVGPKIFFQKIAGPAFFKQPTDEAVVNKAINEELPPFGLMKADPTSRLFNGSFQIAFIFAWRISNRRSARSVSRSAGRSRCISAVR